MFSFESISHSWGWVFSHNGRSWRVFYSANSMMVLQSIKDRGTYTSALLNFWFRVENLFDLLFQWAHKIKCRSAHLCKPWAVSFYRTTEELQKKRKEGVSGRAFAAKQRQYDLHRSIFCLSISHECVKQWILNTHKKQHTFCLSMYRKWISFFVAANSTFFQPLNWPLKWPFWSNFLTEGVVFHEELGNAKKA